MNHDNDLPVKAYHPVTRWLHLGLVLGVLLQLAFAALMAHPDHHATESNEHASSQSTAIKSAEVNHDQGLHDMSSIDLSVIEASHLKHEDETLGAWLMQAHRVVGLLLVVIVFLNLAWAVMRRGELKTRQMAVLFSKQHWCEAWFVAKNLPLMLMGRKALVKPGNSLSLIVEMLGLLTMTAMASTGFMIWNFWAGLGSKVSPLAELLMQFHGMFALLLLAYLAGHVGMALLHLRSGDAVFARILPFKLRKEQ